MPGYLAFWTEKYNKLKSENQQIIGQFPNADGKLKQLLKVIRDIEEIARYIPASVGESEQWSTIVSTTEENRQNCCKVLNGKNVINALYGR
jgi:predicted O-linked N-acetylglucosamine transferase (SPINDLY family)